MNEFKRSTGGSRFLFEPFQYGPKEFQAAHDQILQMKFDAVDVRLQRIETLMESMERRLWLTVYGVAGAVLATIARTVLTFTPMGGL